jgi:hypothetical protein
MKKYGKIMVLMAISLMIISGVAIMGNGKSNTAQPASAPKSNIPFVLKYAFSMAGAGNIFYANGLIFDLIESSSSNTKVYVYKPSGIEVATLNLGEHFDYGLPISPKEVEFVTQDGYTKLYYQIFNTTDYILGPVETFAIPSPSGFLYEYVTILPNGDIFYPIYNSYSLGDFVINGSVYYWHQSAYTPPDWEYFTYDVVESTSGIIGFGMYNQITNSYDNISLPSTISMINFINSTEKYNVAPPNSSDYPSVPYPISSFIPTFDPYFIFYINSSAVGIFGRQITGMTFGNQTYNMTGGNFYTIVLNFNNHHVSIVQENNAQYNPYIPSSQPGSLNSGSSYKFYIHILGQSTMTNTEITNFTFIYNNYSYIQNGNGIIVLGLNASYSNSIYAPVFGNTLNLNTEHNIFDPIIINNTLIYASSNTIYAFDFTPHTITNIFQDELMDGAIFYIGQMNNTILISSTSTTSLYDFSLEPEYDLTINIFGISTGWNVSVNSVGSGFVGIQNAINHTQINSNHFIMPVFPIAYYLNVSAPLGYDIYSITASGKGIALTSNTDILTKFYSTVFNVSSDPTVNITFIPKEFKITFNSNLNQGISWLSHWNLEKNVTWQVRIYHGSDPSAKIIYSSYTNNSSLSNYTLIQNSTTENMTFALFNGTYKYSVFSMTKLFITNDVNENLTVSGSNQSIQVLFSGNYPKAVISFVPSKIPLDTAWVISGENSSGGVGLNITNYSWTITGPANYILSGQSNIIYFNQVGNYTISLTVYNQYGLKNTTTTTTEIIKFTVSNEISMSVSLKGVFTNTSADYQIEVKIPKNMSIASVEALIDNSTSMNIKFVNSSTNGNYSFYFYLASFNPSSLPYGNHFLNFSAYTTTGQFNYYHFTKTFGSVSKSSFNLISFFGGPENFWAMMAAIIGVLITVASLKISRSTVVEIPTVKNGKEYVAEAKLKSVKVKTPKNKKGGRKI